MANLRARVLGPQFASSRKCPTTISSALLRRDDEEGNWDLSRAHVLHGENVRLSPEGIFCELWLNKWPFSAFNDGNRYLLTGEILVRSRLVVTIHKRDSYVDYGSMMVIDQMANFVLGFYESIGLDCFLRTTCRIVWWKNSVLAVVGLSRQPRLKVPQVLETRVSPMIDYSLITAKTKVKIYFVKYLNF